MVENGAQILNRHRPLFGDAHGRQAENLHQSVIGNEGALGFGHFSQLTIEIFNRIGRVNKRSDFRRILEHGGQFRSVYVLAFHAGRVFRPPFGVKSIKRR